VNPLVTQYRVPDAAPKLVYMFPDSSLYNKLRSITYTFLCTSVHKSIAYCCESAYSYKRPLLLQGSLFPASLYLLYVVDIHHPIHKPKLNNISAQFSNLYLILSLNNNYLRFESRKAASALINVQAIDDDSSSCRGWYDP
jgi:hypothetical protein